MCGFSFFFAILFFFIFSLMNVERYYCVLFYFFPLKLSLTLKISAGNINNIIVFVKLMVPLNLLFCIKISNNEIFVFQIILGYSQTSMDTEEGGLHAHTVYNPDAGGSTTTEQGTGSPSG